MTKRRQYSNKSSCTYTTKMFYHEFVDTTEYDTDYVEYKKFIDAIFKKMFDLMFTHKFHLVLPKYAGDIFLITKKPTGVYNQEKYTKRSHHGKFLSVVWRHRTGKLRTRTLYKFKLNKFYMYRRRWFQKNVAAGVHPEVKVYPFPLRYFMQLK